VSIIEFPLVFLVVLYALIALGMVFIFLKRARKSPQRQS
jgi:hypothetical protein